MPADRTSRSILAGGTNAGFNDLEHVPLAFGLVLDQPARGHEKWWHPEAHLAPA